MKVEKGAWVRIHDIILEPSERATHLPEDTKKVPLELWNKGFLLQDATIGDRVEIRTLTDRKVTGELIEVNPHYDHDYGKFVPELLQIGLQLRGILWGGEDHE
ncbi:MAG: 2-amino-4-ketopentanoate thiolase [Clostridiaceae bacterium]|nr:2-amino-4-ketopentanoate thiolase [Clostridiaceae bacterium]